MISFYLISSVLIGGLLYFNRNYWVNLTLVVLFVILQSCFTYFEFHHKNIIDLVYFTPDSISLLMLGVLLLISIPSVYHSFIYLKANNDNSRNSGIYFSALVILITSISAAYVSNHIAVTWVFVELTTLSAAALIYHRRNARSIEATWKYIFICAISVTLVFIGILFFSIAMQEAGSKELSYKALIALAPKLNPFWMRLAFLFIFTGFTAKAGLVPMFTAGIDAKDKAPSPAGAIFASALMNVGFIGIFRSYEIIANSPLHSWANFTMLIASILSLFFSAVYMSKVINVKRMFAYSGMEHMGLSMLGLVAGGIGYYAAVLHIVLHSLIKSSLFFQMGQIYRVFQSKSTNDMGSYFKYNQTGALVFLLAFFCATAIPPSGLFASEFLLFRSLISSGHITILILVLFFLTMILWSFGRNVFKICFTPPSGMQEDMIPKISPLESVSQILLLGISVYIGFNPPDFVTGLLHESVAMIPNLP